jgi:hypothetical protein
MLKLLSYKLLGIFQPYLTYCIFAYFFSGLFLGCSSPFRSQYSTMFFLGYSFPKEGRKLVGRSRILGLAEEGILGHLEDLKMRSREIGETK